MGKLRPVVVLGVAAIIALIATSIIYTSIKKSATGGKEAVIETRPIGVAIVDLNWGTVITKEMVKMEPFLKKSLPSGSFSDLSNLIGRVIISPIKALEPILESRLAPTTITTGGVAAVISPKMRAIAVRVDKHIGVPGFIRPGNRVDVLVTLSASKNYAPVTKTVLENALVRTVGPEIEKRGKEERPSEVDVITLEVTPGDAEKLALASSEGKLQLTLRGFYDTEDVMTKGTSVPILLASYSGGMEEKVVSKPVVAKRTPAPVKPPAPVIEKVESVAPVAPKKPVFVVDVIKGSNVSAIKFEGGDGQ